MTKEEFIQKVLKHKKNTVFVDKHLITRTLEIFEDLGMMPPPLDGVTEVEVDCDGNLSINLWEWE